MSAADVFAAMAKAVEVQGPSLVAQVAGTIQFDITQADGTKRSWTANLKDAPGSVTTGGLDGADLTVGMSEEDFLGMHDGTLDPQVAFMSGKILFVGDIALAFKLGTVIQTAQAQALADEAAEAAAAAEAKGEEPPPPPPPPPPDNTSCFLRCRVCCKLSAMTARQKAKSLSSATPKAGGVTERTPLLADPQPPAAPAAAKISVPPPPPPPPPPQKERPTSNPQAAKKERRFSNEGMALPVEQPRMGAVKEDAEAEAEGAEEGGGRAEDGGATSNGVATGGDEEKVAAATTT